MSIRILIVEDEFIEANNLKLTLNAAGYIVCSIARSVPTALIVIEKENPDLVLIDIFLQGDETGIDLAKKLEIKHIPFVFISANSNREVLDAAKSTKPYGFLVKPFRRNDVLVMLDVAWYLHQSKQQAGVDSTPLIQEKTSERVAGAESKNIIGKSQGIVDLLNNIALVSKSNTSVLILGESGTGKELVAREIHQSSSRRTKPLIVVNCAALPANLIESELFGHEKGAFTGALNKRIGKFEQADEGTIFLDEIGELPLDSQAKLLRVLQEREVEAIGGKPKKISVRVVAATNKDLEEEVAAGRFRIDLYYRLNVFPVLLPPLRERKEDILPLANHFLEKYSREEGRPVLVLSTAAADMLLQYNWPGNIRELENTIQRNVVLAKSAVIDTLEIPILKRTANLTAGNSAEFRTITENERDHILAVLKSCKWKISGKGGAAEILDINANTLNSRIKKLGIERQ